MMNALKSFFHDLFQTKEGREWEMEQLQRTWDLKASIFQAAARKAAPEGLDWVPGMLDTAYKIGPIPVYHRCVKIGIQAICDNLAREIEPIAK